MLETVTAVATVAFGGYAIIRKIGANGKVLAIFKVGDEHLQNLSPFVEADANKGSSTAGNSTVKAGEKVVENTPIKPITFYNAQLQAKFKHAEDFGVNETYNKQSLAKYKEVLQNHINASENKVIEGTYPGNKVVFYTNPNNGLTIMQKPDGAFISGWKLGPEQIKNVLERSKL